MDYMKFFPSSIIQLHGIILRSKKFLVHCINMTQLRVSHKYMKNKYINQYTVKNLHLMLNNKNNNGL